MTHDDYREFFAADVAEMTAGERRAVNNVARNFYRWKGHGCTVGELLDAITSPPRVEPTPPNEVVIVADVSDLAEKLAEMAAICRQVTL